MPGIERFHDLFAGSAVFAFDLGFLLFDQPLFDLGIQLGVLDLGGRGFLRAFLDLATDLVQQRGQRRQQAVTGHHPPRAGVAQAIILQQGQYPLVVRR